MNSPFDHSPLNRRQFGRLCSIATASAATASAWSAPSSDDSFPTHEDTFALKKAGKKIPVILDTDLGSDIDDTWALLYLLRCPELETKLVAADAGQGMYRARLAAKFLTECDRTDVPVAIGQGDPNQTGHQRDWLGDYSLDSYQGTVLPSAVDAIIDTIHASPDPVTLVCIGGVPNIAAALKKDPTICRNARFVGMHGAIKVGYGNQPPAIAEANVRANPQALKETFAAPWQCSITPLDTCGMIVLRGELYRRVLEHKDPGTQALIENYRAWITRCPWLDVKPDPESVSSTLFDLVAIYMAHDESLLKMETMGVEVTEEGMTRVNDQAPNVRVAMQWNDVDAFYEMMVDRITQPIV